MSVVQNPIIGRARQKLGGTVFTTWKGINVLKGKPLTVANPRTDNQVMRRSALQQIVEIGRQISGAINLGFLEQAFRKSAFNAFVGYNLRNGFNYSSPPTATLLPNDILVSQGTIAQTAPISITLNQGTDTVTFSFSTLANNPGQSSNDLARCVAFNETQGRWLVSATTAARSTGTLAASFPDGFIVSGETVYTYLFFTNSSTRKSSDSVAAINVVP